jgi:hypothetical protein
MPGLYAEFELGAVPNGGLQQLTTDADAVRDGHGVRTGGANSLR